MQAVHCPAGAVMILELSWRLPHNLVIVHMKSTNIWFMLFPKIPCLSPASQLPKAGRSGSG